MHPTKKGNSLPRAGVLRENPNAKEDRDRISLSSFGTCQNTVYFSREVPLL